MSNCRLQCLLALLAALVVSGCGGDGGSSGGSAVVSPAPNHRQPSETVAQGARESAEAEVPTDLKDTRIKPVLAKPTGPIPTKLESKDIIKGTGKAAKVGDVMTVDFVGVKFSDGKEFDSSWDRGHPFSFQLGSHQVIDGWEDGLGGMKMGGRRELLVPPLLAYGKYDGAVGKEYRPAGVGDNEAFMFVIDLKKLN